MGWPDGFTLVDGPSLADGCVGVGGGISGVFVRESGGRDVTEGDIARSITTGGGMPGQGYPAVRLEDGHLQSPPEGSSCAFDPQPDGVRYAACGDGVVAPVGTWIGRRISAVDAGEDPDAA